MKAKKKKFVRLNNELKWNNFFSPQFQWVSCFSKQQIIKLQQSTENTIFFLLSSKDLSLLIYLFICICVNGTRYYWFLRHSCKCVIIYHRTIFVYANGLHLFYRNCCMYFFFNKIFLFPLFFVRYIVHIFGHGRIDLYALPKRFWHIIVHQRVDVILYDRRNKHDGFEWKRRKNANKHIV